MLKWIMLVLLALSAVGGVIVWQNENLQDTLQDKLSSH